MNPPLTFEEFVKQLTPLPKTHHVSTMWKDIYETDPKDFKFIAKRMHGCFNTMVLSRIIVHEALGRGPKVVAHVEDEGKFYFDPKDCKR